MKHAARAAFRADAKGRNMRKGRIGTGSRIISETFFRLLPVQVLLMAVSSVNALIDGSIAGRVIGPEAMTLIGLFMPAKWILDTVCAVFLGGSQILCGRFLGKNLIERTRAVFSLNLASVAVFSAVVSAGGFLFPEAIARALGASAAHMDGLSAYVVGMAYGIPAMLLCTQLTAFLQIEQQHVRTYTGILLMAALNAGFDVLFVGRYGMGMFGLGLATSVSCWVFFLVLAGYYFHKNASVRFSLRGIRLKDLAEIVRIGLPGADTTFALAVRGYVINLLLQRYAGADGVAALSALNSCGSLMFAISSGIASATRLMSSVYYGEEDREGLHAVLRTALTNGVLIVSGVSFLVFALAGPVTSLFFRDPASEVYGMTRLLFRIYPFCIPLSTICMVFVSYYQSTGRMGIVHALSVMDGFLGVVLSSLVLAPLFGATGVWIAHVLNGVYTTAAILVYARILHGEAPRSIGDLMALPESFGVGRDKRLDMTIRSGEEATETSSRVEAFCRSMGIDGKRSVYAALCMEEMTVNIIEHGFDGRRTHSVDLRVVFRGEDLLLRIKDDCRPFDPKEKLALIDPEDVTHNIGLRMVGRLAKRIQYSHTLGLNVLTILL